MRLDFALTPNNSLIWSCNTVSETRIPSPVNFLSGFLSFTSLTSACIQFRLPVVSHVTQFRRHSITTSAFRLPASLNSPFRIPNSEFRIHFFPLPHSTNDPYRILRFESVSPGHRLTSADLNLHHAGFKVECP